MIIDDIPFEIMDLISRSLDEDSLLSLSQSNRRNRMYVISLWPQKFLFLWARFGYGARVKKLYNQYRSKIDFWGLLKVLEDAAGCGQLNVIQTLLDMEPSLSSYQSPLVAASQKGRIEAVYYLLLRGVKKESILGELPIEVADDKRIQRVLIHSGGKRTLEYAAISAIKSDSVDELRMLLLQPDLQDCETLVETAAQYNKPEIIKLLLSKGYVTSQKYFIFAVCCGDIELAKALNGDPNGFYNGMGPLHEAVRLSSREGIRYLLSINADRQLKDGEGQKPIDLVKTSSIRRVLQHYVHRQLRSSNCQRPSYVSDRRRALRQR